VLELKSRSVPDTPLEPGIGLAKGETRWQGMTGGARRARDTKASNLLIILADLGVGAQHRIHRLEQVAHPLLADRALDHDNQFRLVG
jgi:hypothetical protein